jgi:NitT/TauT family transport system substrate-binding protein
MAPIQTRRGFLGGIAAAGAAGLIRAPREEAAEGTLETTSVRFIKNSGICIAPQYVAEELLRAEGFTDIRYEDTPAPQVSNALAHGKVDFTLSFAVNHIQAIDAGAPITILAGVHIGCFELFAAEDIHGITGLRGKSVGLQAAPAALLTLLAAHVGLDPVKDILWVTDPSPKPIELFAEGKINAFLGFPPEPQELRARRVGHLIFSTSVDRPWSQYFCCMLAGNREYVERHPVATKRVLRAILKSADICVSDPPGVARRLVDGGFTPRYDFALQTINELPYDKWREYDADDTVRFYALRLRDAGLIKSSPQKIAENTDWRIFEDLKRELKA